MKFIREKLSLLWISIIFLFIALPFAFGARIQDLDGLWLDNALRVDGIFSKYNASGTGKTGTAINLKVNCVSDAVDSGAGTHVLTGVIPADVLSLGVTCRVTTVIEGAGAASFALGDGTDADLYGTGIAFAAGTTVTQANYTASPLTQAWSSSAGDLTMTANAGQFDSGNITCCSFYLDHTAASS